MRVVIETIPHNKQRYDTVGDWWWDAGVLHIRVSRLNNAEEEHLIAIHEYVEALLCAEQNIDQNEVTDFDKRWLNGPYHTPFRPGDRRAEPGDSPEAPYHLQHGVATGIERILASAMNLNWGIYEQHLSELTYDK